MDVAYRHFRSPQGIAKYLKILHQLLLRAGAVKIEVSIADERKLFQDISSYIMKEQYPPLLYYLPQNNKSLDIF